MDEISYVGLATIAVEVVWRYRMCSPHHLTFLPGAVFAFSYLMCILVALLDLKQYSVFQSESTRKVLQLLHAMDGVTAVLMGLGIYFKRMDLTILAVLMSTKLFLLAFVTRMVTGRASFSRLEALKQTSRAYIHHVGSFLFVAHPETILLTTLWRGLSMSGHALIAFRDKSAEKSKKSDNNSKDSKEKDISVKEVSVKDNGSIDAKEEFSSYDVSVRYFAVVRQSALVIILICCFIFPEIRRGFGLSGFGHVSYLVVRMGPVFQLSSSFLPPSLRRQWLALSELSKMQTLFSSRSHRWLLVELALMAVAAIYFLYLRFTLTPAVTDQCEFV